MTKTYTWTPGKLTPVPGTNKRIGVDNEHAGIDFFWRSNRSGLRIGNRLGVIEARPFENDFHLRLEDGDQRGLTYTNASYAVLLQTLLLAYDGK